MPRVGVLLQARMAQTPDQYFGFHIGADGELAPYPKIVEYLQHLSKTTNRVKFEELGKTTIGNPYVLATISPAARSTSARSPAPPSS